MALAVVGCGRIAHSHLQAIQELPERIRLIGVADVQTERAEAAQQKYGAGKWYPSAQGAFHDDQVEAVVLCLPHDLHHPVAIEALNSGKHVLVEKPMALTTQQADDMVAVAEKNGRRLMVGQSRRFFNAVIKSKTLVEDGRIGRPFHVMASLLSYMDTPATPWWASAQQTGGLLIPLWGSHLVDYVLWIYGSKPARVYAETFTNHPTWEGEDEVSALMGFGDGGMATVQMSWNVRQEAPIQQDAARMWRVEGSQRYERVVVGSQGVLRVRGDTELTLNGRDVPTGAQELSNFAWQLKEFADCIREDREPLTSGAIVRDTVEVCQAMRRSSIEHDVVCLA